MAGTVPSHLTTRRQRLRTISRVLPNIWAPGNTVFTVGATTGRGYPRKTAPRTRQPSCYAGGLRKQAPSRSPPNSAPSSISTSNNQYQQQRAKLPPLEPNHPRGRRAREDTSLFRAPLVAYGRYRLPTAFGAVKSEWHGWHAFRRGLASTLFEAGARTWWYSGNCTMRGSS
jgi:hypothetical protein